MYTDHISITSLRRIYLSHHEILSSLEAIAVALSAGYHFYVDVRICFVSPYTKFSTEVLGLLSRSPCGDRAHNSESGIHTSALRYHVRLNISSGI